MDQSMAAESPDNNPIRNLDGQVNEDEHGHKEVKMQLPDLKGNLDTGDEQLPLSRDGGVQDVHIAAFRSSLDSLLIAGRSNAPTSLLRSLREVLKAVINIIEDVKTYERRPLRDVDLNILRSLEERAEATLSILITVITSHASSSGTSPQLVSLLDAAARHVSSTVIEIGRTISARKVTEAEQEMASGYSIRLQDEGTEDDSIILRLNTLSRLREQKQQTMNFTLEGGLFL